MRLRAATAIAIALALGFGVYALVGRIVLKEHGHQGLSDAVLLTARLQLSPDQQQRIEQMNADFGQRREKLQSQHRGLRHELLALLRATPPDRERIAAKLDELGQVQTRMQKLAVEHVLAVSAELDEQQRERLFALIDDAMCPGAMMGHGTGCR